MQYKTGTATFTNGSATVTGSGTAWLTNVAAGDYIVRVGDVVCYEVASVVSDTSLTLTANYGGVTGSGLSYVVHKDFHPNGAPKWANGDVEFAAIQNRWNAQLLAGTFGTSAFVNTGTDAGDVPLNSDLGAAAYLNTGTAAGELPSNGDLGAAAYLNTGTAPNEIPTNSDLNTVYYYQGMATAGGEVNVEVADTVAVMSPDGMNFMLGNYLGLFWKGLASPYNVDGLTASNALGDNFDITLLWSPPAVDLSFGDSGSKLFHLNDSDNVINTINLPNPYTLTGASASFDPSNVTPNLGTLAGESLLKGMAFKPDGAAVYFVGSESLKIQKLNLSTAWDLSTATLDPDFIQLSGTWGTTSPKNMQISPNGRYIHLSSSATNLNRGNSITIELGTPWDLSTAYPPTYTHFTTTSGTRYSEFSVFDDSKYGWARASSSLFLTKIPTFLKPG